MPKHNSNDTSLVSKFQKFETATLKRSEIKGAPYNPRKIQAHSRNKLKNKIKKIGLVEPLVWNRRTGNLVSGHQRIGIIDELKKSQDYSLTMAVVDLDEKSEKELNIFLNNLSTQGEWDTEALAGILGDLQIEETGFDKMDLEIILDDPKFSTIFDETKDKAATTIEDIEKLKQRKKEFKESSAKKDDVDYYVIVVFQDSNEVTRFLKGAGLPVTDRYIDGHRLATNMGIEVKAG